MGIIGVLLEIMLYLYNVTAVLCWLIMSLHRLAQLKWQ